MADLADSRWTAILKSLINLTEERTEKRKSTENYSQKVGTSQVTDSLNHQTSVKLLKSEHC